MPLTWRDALFPEVFEGAPGVPWMRGVLADGERAAFVMVSATHGTRDGHYLWRLLVDRVHQRRGIGRRALGLLFERLGFVPTGEMIDDEVELVLEL